MLHERFPVEELRRMLVDPTAGYHPHPTADDRSAWTTLPAAVRSSITGEAEALIGSDWPALPATLFLEYARVGDRERFQRPQFTRRAMLEVLVLAECIECRGRFLDDIANGIWVICEESFWGVPAHISVQRAGVGLPDTAEPIVDLFAAETSAMLAWTHELLGERLDQVSPLVRPRIRAEVDRRILAVLRERDDLPWMGFVPRADGRRPNNWNPWICSNWLVSNLLLEQDPERRVNAVAAALRTLDNFLEPYPRDGGCDEGPSYWGRAAASLFDCLETLHAATNGGIDLYGDSLVQEMGRFVYRAHIDGDYYVNFADAPAVVFPDAFLVYRYGQRLGDGAMTAFGRWLIERQALSTSGFSRRAGRPTNLQRVLPALFRATDVAEETRPAAPPLPRDVWLPDIQVMVARDRAGTSAGLLVAAKGGSNDESHNHNDVGTFVIYTDGRPMVVDAGVEAYTAKTFSDRRYEIWTMTSAYHTLLPAFGDVLQAPGAQFAARDVEYEAGDAAAELRLDLAGAYPEAAGVSRWRRTLRLDRGAAVTITDDYALKASPPSITVAIITPCAVDLATPGVIGLAEQAIAEGRVSGSGRLDYDADRFTATSETIDLDDPRLTAVWGKRLARIVLRAADPATSDGWRYSFSASGASRRLRRDGSR